VEEDEVLAQKDADVAFPASLLDALQAHVGAGAKVNYALRLEAWRLVNDSVKLVFVEASFQMREDLRAFAGRREDLEVALQTALGKHQPAAPLRSAMLLESVQPTQVYEVREHRHVALRLAVEGFQQTLGASLALTRL